MRPITLYEWMTELGGSALQVGREASEIVRAAAFQAQAYARGIVPVDTGFLRSSITVGHPSGRDSAPGDLVAQVGPEAEYGGYVEYGTPSVGPRPYMEPAAAVIGKLFEERMSREVGIR